MRIIARATSGSSAFRGASHALRPRSSWHASSDSEKISFGHCTFRLFVSLFYFHFAEKWTNCPQLALTRPREKAHTVYSTESCSFNHQSKTSRMTQASTLSNDHRSQNDIPTTNAKVARDEKGKNNSKKRERQEQPRTKIHKGDELPAQQSDLFCGVC